METLAPFKWGHSFWDLNHDLLELYAKCSDGAAVIAAQEEFLRSEQAKRLDRLSEEPLHRTRVCCLLGGWIIAVELTVDHRLGSPLTGSWGDGGISCSGRRR